MPLFHVYLIQVFYYMKSKYCLPQYCLLNISFPFTLLVVHIAWTEVLHFNTVSSHLSSYSVLPFFHILASPGCNAHNFIKRVFHFANSLLSYVNPLLFLLLTEDPPPLCLAWKPRHKVSLLFPYVWWVYILFTFIMMVCVMNPSLCEAFLLNTLSWIAPYLWFWKFVYLDI